MKYVKIASIMAILMAVLIFTFYNMEKKNQQQEENNRVTTSKNDIETLKYASGRIFGSIDDSMQQANVPTPIIKRFINLLAYAVDFQHDIKTGDKFDLVYESLENKDGKFIKYGEVIYAELVLQQQKISLYRYKDTKGKVDYYTIKGQVLKRSANKDPLDSKSEGIILNFGTKSSGVVYEAPVGASVYAVADGVITDIKTTGAHGNYIKINHNSEYSTEYGYLLSLDGVYENMHVIKGQHIGYAGYVETSNKSNTSGLYYGVIKNGKHVDPLKTVIPIGDDLRGEEFEKFKEMASKINAYINELKVTEAKNTNIRNAMPDWNKYSTEELEKALLLPLIKPAMQEGVSPEIMLCRNRVMIKTICSFPVMKCSWRQYLIDRLSGKSVASYMNKYDEMPVKVQSTILQGMKFCDIGQTDMYKNY